MAITYTPVTRLTQPEIEGDGRRWSGTVTLDNASYVNATGWTLTAANFGMTSIDSAWVSMATVFTHTAVVVATGASLIVKIMVFATDAELATNAGTGLVFNFSVRGV